MPFGFLFGITIYYGNNSKNPKFITHSRGKDLYIREDLIIDNNTELSLCDLEKPYTFKLSEVTTENFIEFDPNKKFKVLCNFQASLKYYPYIKL